MCLAVWHTKVPGGQTDRRQTTAIATLCIASRGKNWVSEN